METVTAKVPSTIEAAALCKMAERGQITGGILDGRSRRQCHQPRSGGDQENRVSGGWAREHCGRSRLRGRQHAGQEPLVLAKADAAGIVLGARVPVILTSRANSLVSRLASCAIAVMAAAARRRAAAAAIH